MEERSRELFTMLRCVIHHQCNTERSGAEMEERSRELFTMLRCVIHHQCNAERSGAEMEKRKKGPGNILQCSGALSLIIVTRSGAELSGDRREVQGTFYNVQVRYSSSV